MDEYFSKTLVEGQVDGEVHSAVHDRHHIAGPSVIEGVVGCYGVDGVGVLLVTWCCKIDSGFVEGLVVVVMVW